MYKKNIFLNQNKKKKKEKKNHKKYTIYLLNHT